MCGFNGLITKNNEKISNKLLEKMNDRISHRGPDDSGFYINDNVAFGHRRLSIIDLSSRASQPMQFKKGRYTIIYNGEIYNYIELKEKLLRKDYKFNTHSDTEVILASYDMWGKNCVHKFNGMWSFAIYDKIKEKIFCSRDRFGIKPFYYMDKNDKFVFSSEIKPILLFSKKNTANRNAIIDYLAGNLLDHTEETFFKDIYRLKGGYNLVYDLNRKSYNIYQYYKVDKETMHKDKYDINKFDNLLRDSIKLRLRSDVKVGTCLSGGIDSSIISSLASDLYSEKNSDPFSAVTAKSEDKRVDESKYAKRVVDSKNLKWHVTEPQYEDFKKNLRDVIKVQEEPFGSTSIYMQHFVMKKAKENGIKVLLDGQGGDELFWGYEYYFHLILAKYLKKFSLKNIILFFKKIKGFNLSKFKTFLQSIVFLFKLRPLSLVTKSYYMKNKKNIYKRMKKFYGSNSLKDYNLNEIFRLNMPALLRYEDKNSMHFSVESRLPMLDYRLLEEVLKIDPIEHYENGYLKVILRKIANKILPKEIAWRKEKFGFFSPEKLWIGKMKKEILTGIKKSKLLNSFIYKDRLNNLSYKELWKLYNIAVWEEIFEIEI